MPFSQILVAFNSLIRKEITRFMRIWTQTLLPSAVTQTLYFLIFGTFIGSQVDNIQGIKYMAFLVPGLIMMAVITNSFSNTVSSFFGAKFQKNVEELIVSPTPNWVILAGYVAGGVLRGILVGIIVFVISMIFNYQDIQIKYPIIVSLFVVLTAVAFSLGGFLNGLFARKFDDVAIVPTFVLTPLTYLAGIFYSIERLPQFWQAVSRANPILYMVNGFRFGFYGVSDVNVWVSFGILMVLIVALSAVNMVLLNRGYGLKS
ncbi:MAG: ABC transporter permease [Patescibacteria group bacterium]